MAITDPIPATYVASTSFTVSGDRTAEFASGVKVQAICGADGTFYGVVTSSSYASGTGLTTVVLSMDSGSLTSNLTGVLHGNNTPQSLANHGHTGPGNGGSFAMPALTAIIASIPGHYSRDQQWAAKTVSVATDRYTLLSPNRLAVDVGGVLLWLTTQQSLALSLAATWDSQTTDYTVAANRAGKDFYVYACNASGVLKLLISANSTYPTGYSTTTSRKIGGFHCLCAAAGTISGHALTGYAAGDILPASVWDLKFRSAGLQEGTVYYPGLGWGMIYLPSYSSGKLVSAYGGTIADGASTWGSNTGWNWYDFCNSLAAIGMRPMSQAEFMAFSDGSNQGTNIFGSSDPVTTGGHSDTSGQRMISSVGCEDMCGVEWQWLNEAGGPYNTSGSYVDQYTTATAQRGQGYQVSNRGFSGAGWNAGVISGSRGSFWGVSSLTTRANFSSRGIANAIILL